MSHDHHQHEQSHAHHHAPQSFNAAFSIAVIFNLAFTIFQCVFALYAGSMSLLADAAHNFGDVFGLMLAWGANWLLTLPARKRYSYGFKRTTIVAAIINSLILVATSTLIAYESIHKLLNMTEVNAFVVIIVASIGILINGGTALLFMRGAHEDLNIKGAFLHLLSDAFLSLGVVVSAIIIYYTGSTWLDPVVGLLIVMVILMGTWGLLRDSVSLILDAVPRHVDEHSVKEFFQQLPGVRMVHDLHIWGLSTKEIALTVHLIMPEKKLSDADFENINKQLKSQFRINHVTIQVETGDHSCLYSDGC